MKLYIVRHGETEDNVAGILQGHTHGILTARGRQQAAALAQRLKEEIIDVAYCSDLARAVETLKIIQAVRGAPSFVTTELLRERSLGVYEGQHGDLYRRDFEKSGQARTDFKPEGGESIIEVQFRTTRLLTELHERHPSSSVMLCTHGGTIVTLLATILSATLDEILQHRIPNTALTIAELESDRTRIISFNSVEHLKDIEATDNPI